MRKGFIVAVATFAMGLTGLFAMPAKGQQYGLSLGYSSVGFQLHGISGELVLGSGEKDGQRPQGSVTRFGVGFAWGSGENDLTKLLWSGESYKDFLETEREDTNLEIGRRAVGSAGGRTQFNELSVDEQSRLTGEAMRSVLAERDADTVAQGLTDPTKVTHDTKVFILSLTYEYVLSKGVPGLGFIVGGEGYVDDRYYGSVDGTVFDRGIGGGGIIGISYYLKNGVNFALKTGFGAFTPGATNYEDPASHIKIEYEREFYFSPTFSLGYIL